MTASTLASVVAAHPYPDYQEWWPMGADFLDWMSQAILAEWRLLQESPEDEPEGLASVQALVDEYVALVYHREARSDLVADFAARAHLERIRSGEFDALSYAFYRSAYQRLADHIADQERLAQACRGFAVAVGRRFYRLLEKGLALDLPPELATEADFRQLRAALDRLGAFLVDQGYLRDHFAFRFHVEVTHQGRTIRQREEEFLPRLREQGLAYALYEMGYPAILPSAVYLYHTLGEAQHHSSRTMEELFGRVGCQARETDDFDPTGFPSDRVVELWEIRPGSRIPADRR